MRHIRRADYKVMPWKNGGGSTAEIVVYGDKDGFDARLSVAQISASGPFSLFPGVDRILIQLSGKPVVLHHPGESGSITLRLYAPYYFPGEIQTESCIEGSATDFNVMVKRDVFVAGVDVQTLSFEQSVTLPITHSLALIYCAKGSLSVRDMKQTLVQLHGGDTLAINEDDPSVEQVFCQNLGNDEVTFFLVFLRRR